MKTPKSRCPCGKIKSKYMEDCSDCARAKRDARLAEARTIVATGKCPKCGNYESAMPTASGAEGLLWQTSKSNVMVRKVSA